MENEFYIIDENEINYIYNNDIDDIPDKINLNDIPLSPLKLNYTYKINKLLIFVFIYKVSTINWAFLQLPDFVSRHS